MNMGKIKYKSYSVNVNKEDLNPFEERFKRGIKIDFVAPKGISYSSKYEDGIEHGRFIKGISGNNN